MARAPRETFLQVTHFLRHDFTFNSNGSFSPGLTQAQLVANLAAGYNFGTLPPGAIIKQVDLFVDVAFNNGTNNLVSVGFTLTGTDLVNGGSLASQAVVITQGPIAAVTTAKAATAKTGTPLYFSTSQTGTAATAGQCTIIVTYYPVI